MNFDMNMDKNLAVDMDMDMQHEHDHEIGHVIDCTGFHMTLKDSKINMPGPVCTIRL